MKETYVELLTEAVNKGTFIELNLSGSAKRSEWKKALMRPVTVKGQRKMQLALFRGTQVFHENVAADSAALRVAELFESGFKQMLLWTTEADYQIFRNKNGIQILRRPASKQPALSEHNRKKHYILPEGSPRGYLVLLGITDERGQVYKAKYDKFRQVNRFLELIERAIPKELPFQRLRIVEFGCGASLLLFALYDYLVHLRGIETEMIGVDLKADVIERCQKIGTQLQYEGLNFVCADVGEYQPQEAPDMVISLHACDTATDVAIQKAVQWGAESVLSVPCCQKELFPLIRNEGMELLLKHGILKERVAALVTDALRGGFLEAHGYQVVIEEFIDMEHTPKNIMIRAVRKEGVDRVTAGQKYAALKQTFGLNGIFIER